MAKLPQPRSYKVMKENGNIVRRNRRDLIPTLEKFGVDVNYDDLVISDNEAETTENTGTSRTEPIGEPENVQVETEEIPYRSRLRNNTKAPDRYGY